MQGVWFQSLAWEDRLEKETATHSNILAWRIPWTEEPGRLHSMGQKELKDAPWKKSYDQPRQHIKKQRY